MDRLFPHHYPFAYSRVGFRPRLNRDVVGEDWLLEYQRLGLIALITLAVPAVAQDSGAAAANDATAEQVALINSCTSHKFETTIEIDPIKKRGTRVKLCSNPGASDADWVKTLKDAVEQAGKQTSLPPGARAELISRLRQEIAKYEGKPVPPEQGFVLSDEARANPLLEPEERFEVSSLPPLIAPKAASRTSVAAGGAVASAGGATTVAAKPLRSMRFAIKCLEPGQSGAGSTCDFFDKNTILAVRAVTGLEQGGTLRFRRRGDDRGSVALGSMQAGQVTRVRIPAEVCRGVKSSKVEIELVGQDTIIASHRLGPFGIRC